VPLTHVEFLTRLARELEATSAETRAELDAWLNGSDIAFANDCRAGIGSTTLVRVNRIASDGSIDAKGGTAERLVAVLPRLRDARIVSELEAKQRAVRVICDMAVFDVRPEGLVIVELARGTSARDVQKHCEATMLISPAVTVIDVAPSVVSADGPPVL
jgi:hypothetical protein